MSIQLEFKKEKLVPDAKFYLFKPLTDILAWDKEPGKPKGNKMLFFVFLLCDLTENNPLKEVPVSKKEEEAKFRAYSDKNKEFTDGELKYLIPAIECYIKYNTTAEERILKAFDEKSEQLRIELENTIPESVINDKGGVISFASNSSIITKGLRELDSIKKIKMNVISAVRRESMTQRVRGAISLSPLSRGSITLPSIADREV